MLPLIIYSLVELYRANRLAGIVQNKAVLAGAALAFVSLFTAVLSLPFLMQTRSQLVMNGINAFNSHSQIPWWLQSTAVLLTLAATLVYAAYMFRKNSLLSLISCFSVAAQLHDAVHSELVSAFPVQLHLDSKRERRSLPQP